MAKAEVADFEQDSNAVVPAPIPNSEIAHPDANEEDDEDILIVEDDDDSGEVISLDSPEFLAASSEVAHWLPSEPSARWIEHNVRPGESLSEIAARYGVEETHLMRANRLNRKRPQLVAGSDLRVRAQHFPAPQMRSKYRVREEDSWGSIAESFGLSTSTLRRFNRRKGELQPGSFLNVWMESGIFPEEPKVDFRDFGLPAIPEGSQSRGWPYRGRLRKGAQLPESPLYTRRVPRHSYGSSHALRVIASGIADFRQRTNFEGEVIVSGISKRRGGKFPPHRSHQSGRDADIALVAYPSFPQGTRARGADVDWPATWELIRSFLMTGEVQYIFLSYRQQKKLYEAARMVGVPDDVLRRTIQWPRGPKSIYGIVRHEKGHLAHFHLRIRCGVHEAKCKPRRDDSQLE